MLLVPDKSTQKHSLTQTLCMAWRQYTQHHLLHGELYNKAELYLHVKKKILFTQLS